MKKYHNIFIRIVVAVVTLHLCMVASAQDERSSSSMFLTPQTVVNTTVPFYLQDPGKLFPVRWGLDVAWMSEQNIRKGINHIGKANVTMVRGSFRTKDPLINDSVLTTDQTTTLQERIRMARIVSDTVEIILNEDQEAGIDTWYGTKGNANPARWAAMINAHVKWIQEKFPRLKVVAISPFNEPDYS
ncbi:MAG: hypothetical protein J5867_09285, partial [Prevotella sp.]|nr:hypothetical protein [Prevotella sp.]